MRTANQQSSSLIFVSCLAMFHPISRRPRLRSGTRARGGRTCGRILKVIEQAESLDKELLLVRGKLGRYEGEQLTEERTERQLDRWTKERGMGDAADAAGTYMEKVLAELRSILDGLDG